MAVATAVAVWAMSPLFGLALGGMEKIDARGKQVKREQW
jgi:hypothetical protein